MNTDFNFSQQPSHIKVAVLVGLLLVAIGLCNFVSLLVPVNLWEEIVEILGTIMKFLWPIVFVAAGFFILWSVKNGKLDGFATHHSHGVFMRSRTDKRLFGVCGGIAYYFGVDSAIVRIFAVIMLVLLPFPVVIAYFLIAMLIPMG